VDGPAVVSRSFSGPVSFEPAADGARRKRVLLMAYWCHPENGMEARIGWHRAMRSAKHWDTWIVFSNDQDFDFLSKRIESTGLSDSLKLVCVPLTRWERWLARRPELFYWSYGLWQRRAHAIAERLHHSKPFDLVHQVSFCGYRQPGHGWKLGVPFVFGPVGGTQSFPWRFLTAVDPVGGLREAVRNVANAWQLRFSRAVRQSCRRASAVLAANSTGQRDLSRSQRVPVIRHLETGVERSPTRVRQKRRRPNDPLRILWTGRLETWKALPLLLNALAQLPKDCRYELHILGVGKCRRRWQRLAERLGIADSIRWLGWGTYSELLPHYNWADVFAFTSLRDTSGAGLLESLAAGVPIVGVNHQGAADIMTGGCSVAIPVSRPQETIAAFRDAILDLANDPAKLERLSEGARTRATEFLWERQGDLIDRVYRRAFHGETLAATSDEAPKPAIAVENEHVLMPAIAAPIVVSV
jgi:glycosyltransferase involved in cell wall biosynthesis